MDKGGWNRLSSTSHTFGVRQFIAALIYFGLRRVPAPLSFRDTSRVAFETRYVPVLL